MVFISYSSLDKDIANEVRTILERKGFRVWMAPEDILPGSDYGEAIPDAIQNCQAFLFLLSRNSQESKWCPKELDLAIGYGKPVIPFHLDDSAVRDSFRFRLSNIQWIEAVPDKERAYKKLFAMLTKTIGEDSTVKQTPAKKRAKKQGRSFPTAIILAAVVCAAIVIAIGLNFNPAAETAGESSTGTETAAEKTLVSSDDKSAAESDGSTVEPDGASSGKAEATTPVKDSHAATQRAGLEEYSWSELSAIADEIAQSGDPIEVARYYNLADSSGKLGTQTKAVKFAGEKHYVRILGFAQDEKTSGSKAGITFQFTDIVALKQMHGTKSNAGGWAYDNDVRNWLSSRAFEKLPKELRSHIVSVEKRTNNDGKTSKKSSVSTSSDMLWIPSYIEVFGDSKDTVLLAEGKQYQRFREEQVSSLRNSSDSVKNPTLIKDYKGNKTSWWLRSSNPGSSTTVFDVYSTTGEWNSAHANNGDIGICPCFCL